MTQIDHARFWEKVDKRGPITPAMRTRCWLWTGGRGGKGTPSQRYGQYRRRRAHRVSYELLVGAVPSGLVLDHKCRRRECVNPGHLEPVTHRVNILRGEGNAAINARKSACKHGHPLSGRNLLMTSGRKGAPRRACRACALNRKIKWSERNGR